MKLEKFINQPFVETDRFDLRPLRFSDTGLIEFYTKDERVARMTPSIPHPLPAGRRSRCRRQARARVDGSRCRDGVPDMSKEV